VRGVAIGEERRLVTENAAMQPNIRPGIVRGPLLEDEAEMKPTYQASTNRLIVGVEGSPLALLQHHSNRLAALYLLDGH
jgi:hypothetical protein